MLYKLFLLAVPLGLIVWKWAAHKLAAQPTKKRKKEKIKALKKAKKLGLIVYEKKDFQPKLRTKQNIYRLQVIEGKQKK